MRTPRFLTIYPRRLNCVNAYVNSEEDYLITKPKSSLETEPINPSPRFT